MNVFLNWWREATPAERQQLANHCKTSVESLRQEAFAYRSDGILKISLGRAIHLETGAKKLHRDGLPVLNKTDLCPLWKEIEELQKSS